MSAISGIILETSAMSDLFVEPCYIRGRHQYVFRSGEWAVITGVLLANKRPCFSVMFDDGKSDLWPVEDAVADYEFAAKQERKRALKCRGCGLLRIVGEGPCDQCGWDDFELRKRQ